MIASLKPSDDGKALIDVRSPLHVVIGFAAGVLGIEAHIAMLVFLGARIVAGSLSEGPRKALFEPDRGQSLGNELADLMLEVGGLYAGDRLRTKLLAEQQAPAALPMPAPTGWVEAYS